MAGRGDVSSIASTAARTWPGTVSHVVWTSVEHARSHVRLVLSDPTGPDVDLLLRPHARDELGRALFLGGSVAGVAGATVDGNPANISADPGEVSVRVGGDAFRFELGPDAKELGEKLLARPVTYEVECPRCGARATESSTIAPTGEIAMERAASTWWSCPRCNTRVPNSEFVGDSDDIWRVPAESSG